MSRQTALARHALATASLALLCGAAGAQNVQIFGIVDTGILYQTNNGANSSSRTSMQTSNLRQSVWGFKGTEDLGGGLKAFFNLESHIDIDTGALHGDGFLGTAPLFRRQANVGLAGDWGSVTLGRQYGPALLAHIGTEPRAFKENFSSLYTWAYDQLTAFNGGGAVNTNNDVGIFMTNSVQYRGSIGPVSGGILYSFGEVAGETSNNSVLALGLTYSGPVTLSFSHEFMKDANTGEKVTEHTGVGAAYSWSNYTVKGIFHRADNSAADGTRVSEVDTWGLGFDWKWNPSNMITLAYYDAEDKENKSNNTKNLVFGNETYLSKRTTLYATIAIVDADSGAGGNTIDGFRTTIVATPDYLPGKKTTFFNAGINHTF